jgi:hypothetical protein
MNVSTKRQCDITLRCVWSSRDLPPTKNITERFSIQAPEKRPGYLQARPLLGGAAGVEGRLVLRPEPVDHLELGGAPGEDYQTKQALLFRNCV